MTFHFPYIAKLLEAQPELFNVNNVATYFWGHDQEHWDIRDFPNIAPVYEQVCFYYRYPDVIYSKDRGTTKQALGGKTGHVYIVMQSLDVFPPGLPDLGRWKVRGMLFEAIEDFISPNYCMWHWAVTDEGQLAETEQGQPAFWLTGNSPAVKTYGYYFAQRMVSFLHVAFLSLSFLHCQNVSVVERGKPKKRWARKQGRAVIYKTLVIKPLQAVLRREGDSHKTGLKIALHKCRGHFKNYSKGAGLFGKHKGIYYWPDRKRGQVEYGEVKKQYDIQV